MSGEAHGAQNLAGWGPARPTAKKIWQMRSGETIAMKSWQMRSARPPAKKMRSGETHCDEELADEVRRGPLRRRWGPARPTAMKSWQMRSARPLRWSAGRRGPARPTAMKSWQMRSGEAHCDQKLANEAWRGVRRGGKWRKEGRKGRRNRAIDMNLTTFTWQVGNYSLLLRVILGHINLLRTDLQTISGSLPIAGWLLSCAPHLVDFGSKTRMHKLFVEPIASPPMSPRKIENHEHMFLCKAFKRENSDRFGLSKIDWN